MAQKWEVDSDIAKRLNAKLLELATKGKDAGGVGALTDLGKATVKEVFKGAGNTALFAEPGSDTAVLARQVKTTSASRLRFEPTTTSAPSRKAPEVEEEDGEDASGTMTVNLEDPYGQPATTGSTHAVDPLAL